VSSKRNKNGNEEISTKINEGENEKKKNRQADHSFNKGDTTRLSPFDLVAKGHWGESRPLVKAERAYVMKIGGSTCYSPEKVR
jgi:hypothetical protein